ncbi:MAG TPA: hypothetical protein VHY48_08565 [Acidobacteriaceae bacterium]|jgi:hypothetical protein|nr:hypothetical protein [Acidobacteriaceae bacterium]
MNLRTKAILINACIAAGLLFEHYAGASPLVLAIAGVLTFTVANAALVFKLRSSKNNKKVF